MPIWDEGLLAATTTVSGAGSYVWDVDVTTNIVHTYAADLDITLTSPEGTAVTLTTDNGGFKDNVFAGTTWDDDAGVPVTLYPHADNVVSTPVVPEGALAAFIGEEPNGTWSLSIGDDAAGDEGALISWQLDITTLPQAPVATTWMEWDLLTGGGAPIPDGAEWPNGDWKTLDHTWDAPVAPGTISGVRLETDIRHPDNGELEILLISPAATEMTVTKENGVGLADIYQDREWRDDDAASVTDYAHVVGLPFAPEEAFGAFIGENPTGEWRMRITDRYPGGAQGVLYRATIWLEVHRCTVPAPTSQALYAHVAGPFDDFLATIDPTTGTVTPIGPTELGYAERTIAMDMDPTTGKLYAVTTYSGKATTLSWIDTASGLVTEVAQFYVPELPDPPPWPPPWEVEVFDIAFDDLGQLYGTAYISGAPSALLSFDKSTGMGTYVGPSPGGGIAFDSSTGWMTGFRVVRSPNDPGVDRRSQGAYQWFTVDLATGESNPEALTWGGPDVFDLAIDAQGKGYALHEPESLSNDPFRLQWANPGAGIWTVTDITFPPGEDLRLRTIAIERTPSPALTIQKLTNGSDADDAPGPSIAVGAAVTWSYQVTNSGNVALSGVTVRDNNGTLRDVRDDFTADCDTTTLEPGQSMTCTASGTAVLGQYANIATVIATEPVTSTEVSATDPSHYFGVGPALTIQKLTNGSDADDAPGLSIAVGAAVTWSYQVTNSGNVALSGVTVTDDAGTPDLATDDFSADCDTTTLEPGQSMTCTASGTAVLGQYANIATVIATEPVTSTDVSATDPSHYFGVGATGVITGTVTAASGGGPLGDIVVEAHDAGGVAAITDTAADGSYQLVVAYGQYTVRFSDPTATFVAEWYNDVATPEEATVLTLDAGNDTMEGIDAALGTPANDPPRAFDDTATVTEGGTVTGNVLANDTDPDGDTLTAIKVTDPDHGTVTLSADGTFGYTHDGSETLSDSFTYRASDGLLESDIAVVEITITAVLPGTLEEHTSGLVDPATGRWHLRRADGGWVDFYFGNPGDYPIVGDWDCDGIETPGLYRQSDGYVYLRNSNTQGTADIRFFFGNPSDIPLAGDFDGDGCDTVSIYRPSEGRVFIINKLGSDEGGLGAAEYDYYFGNPGDKPFCGDFDNDAIETVGLHRESTGFVYFRQSHTQGIADAEFFYGDPGDRLIAGDWGTVDGIFTMGIFRPAAQTTYLRFVNTQGVADVTYTYGQANWLPVGGYFGL